MRGLAFGAALEHHFEGDGEEQEPAGNAEGGQRNPQPVQQPIAGQGRGGQEQKAMTLASSATLRRAGFRPCRWSGR